MKNLLKRNYRTTYLYLTREFLFSFLVAFLFFFIIFFVNQILLLAEKILSSRIPVMYVLKLIICTFPSILALSFPFATLVGALMALGNLSSNKEILAMECVGISLRRISIPIVFVGIIFCFISFYINDYLLPLGAVHYRRISREIFTTMPSLELEPYSIKFLDNRVVVTSDVDENQFGPILVIENGRQNDRTLIMAPSGYFENNPERLGNFSIVLNDVEQHSVDNRSRKKQTYTKADHMSLNFLFSSLEGLSGLSPQEMRSVDLIKEIKLKQISFDQEKSQWQERVDRAREKLDAAQAVPGEVLDSGATESTVEMGTENEIKIDRDIGSGSEIGTESDIGSGSEIKTGNEIKMGSSSESKIEEMTKQLSALESSPPRDRTLDQWKMEYFQKFAIPFSCFPFVLIAFPLGVISRRSGRAVGFLLGLFLAFFYWAFLIMGRNLTMRVGVSPFLSIWMANILLTMVGGILFIRKIRG